MQLVWVGSELRAGGTVPFDLADVALEHGAAAPLLCLSAVEAKVMMVATTCAPEVACSPYRVVHQTYSLDAASLEVPRAAESPASELPPCAKHKQRRHKGSARAAVGPGKKVTHRGKRVRRCKTG